jgi:hypothetical protein
MATIVEAKNLADLYDLPPVDWAAVTAPLDRGVTQAPETGGPDRHTTWLTTINADGSPHVTGGRRVVGRRHILVRDGRAHPQGAQPLPRPALHDRRLNARVRSRPRGRCATGHRSSDRCRHG